MTDEPKQIPNAPPPMVDDEKPAVIPPALVPTPERRKPTRSPWIDFDYRIPEFQTLEEASSAIQTGWILLFRGSGLISSWIRWLGGGPHTHVAVCHKTADGSIDVLEIREWIGGRILPLEYHYETFRGCIDVFSPDALRWEAEWDAHGAVNVMRAIVKRKYGYRGVLRILMRKLPFIWRLYPVSTSDVTHQDETKSVRPFCSQAIAMAFDIGGNVDVCPRMPHYLVEPSHLTHSLFFKYEFSL